MSSAPRPPRARPTWWEPRFLLGVLLVLVSIAGVSALLAAADRTVQVFAARHTLAAGDELGADDVVAVRVRLGQTAAAYLSALPQDGTVVTRGVARGELVPLGALGSATAQRSTSVVISVDGELPASVAAGETVDVWSAEATREQGGSTARFAAPQVLVPAATVVRVVRDDGLGASGAAVEVRVPKDATAALLEAIANGDAVSVLPAGE